MTNETPVFLSKVECPICKTINEFENIKVGAYTETERDTDFCPTVRTWRNPRYQHVNPLLYFIATCENCFYSREFNNNFKEWKEDPYFKTYRLKGVKENHLEMLAQANSVIKELGQAMDANRYSSETALIKLMLAIIDETLNEKAVNLDLGRFYLRIGWLFRDTDRSENPNHQVMKGHLLAIDDRYEELAGALKNINSLVGNLQTTVANMFEDQAVAAEVKSSLYPIRDKYYSEIKSLRELLSLSEGKTESFKQIIAEHRTQAMGSADGDLRPGFHDHRSLYDFLSHLASRWPGIPVNENEALRFAVQYYVKAFEEGRDIAAGNQQIQASYLIAELSRRIGDYDRAREYFNTTIRAGQEFIYRHKGDRSRTALARKILELAIEQGRHNMAAKTG
jgi:uncharacterized protein (DUF2225 family)